MTIGRVWEPYDGEAAILFLNFLMISFRDSKYRKTNLSVSVSNSQNVSELLTFAVRAGCKAAFYPDKQSATRKQHFGSSLQISDSHQTPSSVVRRCRQHVTGRCDRNWLDRQTNRLCRDGPTSYVFAGRRTFRNRHCAVCNHVNETYLRCTPTENSVAQADRYNSGTNINEPFIIIDMNGRQAVLHSKSSNLDSEYEV